MDKLSNNVARNTFFYAHVSQANFNAGDHAKKNQETKNATTNNFVVDNGTTELENIFNSYNQLIDAIKNQEKQKHFDKNSFKASSPLNKNKECTKAAMANQSNKDIRQEKEPQKSPVRNSKPFNILGLFKPGEFLNKVDKDETNKIRIRNYNVC